MDEADASSRSKKSKRAEAERERRQRVKLEQEALRRENDELRREREALVGRLAELERAFVGTPASASASASASDDVHARAVLDAENVYLKAQVAQHELFMRAVRRCSSLVVPAEEAEAGGGDQLAGADADGITSAAAAAVYVDGRLMRDVAREIAMQTVQVAWDSGLRLLALSRWRGEWSEPCLVKLPSLLQRFPEAAIVTRWAAASDGTRYIRGDFFVPMAPPQTSLVGKMDEPARLARDAWLEPWTDRDAMLRAFPRSISASGQRVADVRAAPLFSLRDGRSDLRVTTSHVTDANEQGEEVEVVFLAASRRDAIAALSLECGAATLQLARSRGGRLAEAIPVPEVEASESASTVSVGTSGTGPNHQHEGPMMRDVFTCFRTVSREGAVDADDAVSPSAATAPVATAMATGRSPPPRATWPFSSTVMTWRETMPGSSVPLLRTTLLNVLPLDMRLTHFGFGKELVSEASSSTGGLSDDYLAHLANFAVLALRPAAGYAPFESS